MNQEVFAAVADALERGEPAALVTIVSTTGSTPQRVGAKMLVFADGRIVGTIGGGCYENDAFGRRARRSCSRAAAARALRAGRRLRAGDRADLRRTDGRLHRADRAVARALRRSAPATSASTSRALAQEVGFRVHVVDDREKFANRERFPDRRRDRRRGHPGLDRATPHSRRTPTSSSSRAATPTISRRCARWRRASCAISA